MDKSSSNIIADKMLCNEDYTHSSNSLFHFMKQPEHLVNSLRRKALTPRYCLENIGYLNIERDSKQFLKMAVLLKCFCDIPLHKITNHYERGLSSEKQADAVYNHTSLYGEYALAFSKTWGEMKLLLPIHYLNSYTVFSHQFVCGINEALSGEANLSETVENSYLSQLAYLKPLRGKMERQIDKDTKLIDQNFYDEQEWRFIPPCSFKDSKFPFIIANPHLLNNQSLSLSSTMLEKQENHEYWLKFEYNDIRYIIVPNPAARIVLIDAIMELDERTMDDDRAKYLLISKILVLAEVRKDW